ncbi:hypothetical protein APY03_1220 [Variovorax sp. WDL1]|nr:hypothetical protein APY03_1220 [Variovorax sp. WDL1]
MEGRLQEAQVCEDIDVDFERLQPTLMKVVFRERIDERNPEVVLYQ